MSKVLKITMPLILTIPRKTKKAKKWSVNLNIYRNSHHRLLNETKKLYKEMVEDYLKENGITVSMFDQPVTVTFQLFKATRRRTDKSNFYSVHAKYLYDSLTELGFLVDDNDDYIKEELLLETVHDKDNPRVEFTFTTIK